MSNLEFIAILSLLGLDVMCIGFVLSRLYHHYLDKRDYRND